MIRFHSLLLIVCSAVAFIGHYIQFGVARLTPWVPATAGLLIFLFTVLVRNKRGVLKYLPIVAVLAFGILTTNMCIRFLPQEFQPVRKKIIFSLMSIPAFATLLYEVRLFFERRWQHDS